MNRTMRKLAATAILLAAAGAASADYGLDWFTIDGGGETFSTGGSYSLGGTIGQPDAEVSVGGGYTLTGGFWAGAAASVPLPCPEDLNYDGLINIADLSILLSNFGTMNGAAHGDGDIDGDGDVDIGDLSALLSVYGTACP